MHILNSLEISNDELKRILLDEEITYISNLQTEFNQSDELNMFDKGSKSKSTVEDHDAIKEIEE